MKKLLLVVFLFLCFSGLRVQLAYIPFTDNMIIYSWGMFDDIAGLHPPSYARIELAGDTVLGAFRYFKIYL